jgi:hypothetical protein
LLFAAAAARAQFQTGSLLGTVTDGTKPLAGVRVTLSGASEPRVLTTDQEGRLRVLALDPGIYQLRAEAPGYAEVIHKAVSIHIGRSTAIQIQMSPIPGETITVTADPPLLDLGQVSLRHTFAQHYLEKAALGSPSRTYQSVLRQASGVGGAANQNILGSTIGENVYLLDGLNTTDPATALYGLNFSFDAIEEISFHKAGFEAEWGNATGGIVNLVTKSGSNRYSGTADLRFRDDAFYESGRYFDPQAQPESGFNAGATLGGPLLRDRLWFFAAAGEEHSRMTPEASPATLRRSARFHLGKLAWQPSSLWRVALKYAGDPAETDNRAASRFVRPEATGHLEQGAEVLQAEASALLSDRFRWEVRGGSQRTEVDVVPQSGDLDTAAHYDLTTGVWSVNYWSTQFSRRGRDELKTSATYLLDHHAGTHELKAGLEAADLFFDIEIFTPSGFRYEDLDGQPLRLWHEPSAGPTVNDGRQEAVFVQDSWRPTSQTVLNLGMRYDEARFQNDAGEEVASLEKVQPRLGAAWDILGDARTIARASWGVFMHPNSTTMPNFARHATLPTFAYRSCTSLGLGREDCQSKFAGTASAGGVTVPRWIDDPQRTDPSGFALRDQGVFNAAPNTIDDDLEAMYAETLAVGVERQVAPATSLELSYVKKRTRDIFEDTCEGNVDGPSADADCGSWVMTNLDGLARDWEGAILELESRAVDRVHLLASYTYSKSRGNVEYTQNVGTDFDVFPVHFVNRYGYLSDDRRHRLKVNGYVDLPRNFTLGVDGSWASPAAFSKTEPAAPYGTLFLEPRGSRRGTDYYALDLELRKGFEAGRARAALIATVFNVLDHEGETERCGLASGCGEGIAYGSPTGHQLPRRWELGLRLEF